MAKMEKIIAYFIFQPNHSLALFTYSHVLFINTRFGQWSGVDFTKGFKTWQKFSTEIRFMLIPIILLFIAHVFITGNF